MTAFFSKQENQKNLPAILTRIAQADESAAQECVEIYGRMIWALAKKYTDSLGEAERVVPEIFTDIWNNAKFCDLEISDEVVWIALIARRRLSRNALKDEHQSSTQIPMEFFTSGFGKIQPTSVAA